eukprot:11896804-Alexandrium_andersonii.AAC.1
MSASLVGSEMCIRDRQETAAPSRPAGRNVLVPRSEGAEVGDPDVSVLRACLLYTSDAADDM